MNHFHSIQCRDPTDNGSRVDQFVGINYVGARNETFIVQRFWLQRSRKWKSTSSEILGLAENNCLKIFVSTQIRTFRFFFKLGQKCFFFASTELFLSFKKGGGCGKKRREGKSLLNSYQIWNQSYRNNFAISSYSLPPPLSLSLILSLSLSLSLSIYISLSFLSLFLFYDNLLSFLCFLNETGKTGVHMKWISKS